MSTLSRTAAERDLFAIILGLSSNDVTTVLGQALAALGQATSASAGLLAVFDREEDVISWRPRWKVTTGLDGGADLVAEQRISRTWVRELRSGDRLRNVPCALEDEGGPSESVVRNEIGAVLGASFGTARRAVLYLHRPWSRLAFQTDDERLIELFIHHLAPLVDRLTERAETAPEPPAVRELRQHGSVGGLVGRSDAMVALMRDLSVYAPVAWPLLITGPTGVGKTHLARVAHDLSARAGRVFFPINCAAVSEVLFEREFFGVMGGSVTGVAERQYGYVEVAHGGTLFLDQVCDIPLHKQAVLLTFLDTGTFRPVCSAEALVSDVRVVAASNRNLDELVAQGLFRRDLLERLRTLHLHVPALADRREDIGALAEHFGSLVSAEIAVPWHGLSPDARRCLEDRSWDGNIRSLRAVMRRAVAVRNGSGPVRVADLDRGVAAPETRTLAEQLEAYERKLLVDALREAGSVLAVANRLSVGRSTLYERVRRLGIEPEEWSSPRP